MPVWFWVTLWSVLVVATVLGALLLGRWLWRALQALTTEVERAEERHGPALVRLDAALEAQGAGTSSDSDGERRASMFAHDLTTHYARVAAVREARADRKVARRARHEQTWERWQHFND
ncbi:hypothetical protein GCM10028784_21870 [Myceligenerans cantabricum]